MLKKCVNIMKKWIGILTLLLAVAMATGCVMKQGGTKQRDLEYTVADVNDLPQALREQLETKKGEDFSLTYSDNQYLYAVRGYGVQETGGYSISVEDCYLTENEICVKTTLHGPAVGENVAKSPSYPYIVLKLELRQEPVVFADVSPRLTAC